MDSTLAELLQPPRHTSSTSTSQDALAANFGGCSTCATPRCRTPSRGILRKRPQARRSDSPGSKCVSFANDVDEHPADDWDRTACKAACPTYREVLELKQIMLELLPERRGLCGPEYSLAYDDSDVGSSQYFNIHDDDDVDPGDRRRAPPPRRQRLLKSFELCPILPATTPASTPINSRCGSPMSGIHSPPQSRSPSGSPSRSHQNSPTGSPSSTTISLECSAKSMFTSRPHIASPLGSPPVTPMSTLPLHQPYPKPKAMMTFLPMYPSPPSEEATPLSSKEHSCMPTPPMTPTLAGLQLEDDATIIRSEHKHSDVKRDLVESTPEKVFLPSSPLTTSPPPPAKSSSPRPLSTAPSNSAEPSNAFRRKPILPIIVPQRTTHSPSPPPHPLLQSLASCSPSSQNGMPCSINFKARANMAA